MPPAPLANGRPLYAVTANPRLAEDLAALWNDAVVWHTFESGAAAWEQLFNDAPEGVLVDLALPDMGAFQFASFVKGENVYRQMPVILCVDRDAGFANIDFFDVDIDDMLVLPFEPHVARARIELALARAQRAMDANPLTKLPGNTTIINHIQSLIERREHFGLAYVDLDHFKSFNDKYGFARGDEVLMMAARVVVNTIRGFRQPDSFVGHIGGDDFVFTLPADMLEEASRQIIRNFDAIVPSFYDAEDRERGGIESSDRQGVLRQFPLMTVSISVVMNHGAKLTHYGQAAAIATALKAKAKKEPGSSYVVDARRS
jgi:diguanylate cyclase (GGDEF)-like protein